MAQYLKNPIPSTAPNELTRFAAVQMHLHYMLVAMDHGMTFDQSYVQPLAPSPGSRRARRSGLLFEQMFE